MLETIAEIKYLKINQRMNKAVLPIQVLILYTIILVKLLLLIHTSTWEQLHYGSSLKQSTFGAII